jgi:hypothetical protein
MIDRDTFWALIEEARVKVKHLSDIPNWLIEVLQNKPVSDIANFHERRLELIVKAYDARLWTAVELMLDGCGDDTFVDFRDWLICQGQKVYEAALENPDILAGIDQTTGDHGKPLLFDFGSVAIRACEAMGDSCRLSLDFSKYSNPVLANAHFKKYDGSLSNLGDGFPRLYAQKSMRNAQKKTDSPFRL